MQRTLSAIAEGVEMDIYLVRHGEAAATWAQSSDPGLSELGWQQAQQSAQTLLEKVGDDTQLLSSPLARARETAEPLAQALQRPVEINDAFREIPSSVPLAERQIWLRAFMKEDWDTQSDNLLQWRDQAWQQLLGLHQPAVIFTHFLLLNAVVGQAGGRAETLCFYPDNGSITHLRRNGAELQVVQLGEEMDTLIN